MRHSLLVIVVSAAPLYAPTAQAQTLPNAGTIRQQIEQGRELALPQQALPVLPPEPVTKLGPAGLQIQVKTFQFAGNTLLDSTQLQSAVRNYLNRTLDYSQLQNAAAAVADLYRKAGWVVRTFLPEQQISSGMVIIQVVEATLGKVVIEGKPSRVDPQQIKDIVSTQQKPGKVLNANAVDRALLLADDLPGVAVSGSLREGTESNQTDLVLRLSDKPLVSGEAVLDNNGNLSTGDTRLGATINLNSALHMGDLLSANFIHSSGSDYVRLGATMPLGSDGWRAGISASALNYKLVLDQFAPLNAHGTSNSTGLEASYPLVRSRLRNLYVGLNADHKTYDNEASATTTSNYSSDSYSLSLWGNVFDTLGGGGTNNANLNFISGQLNLAGSPNSAADAAGARTAGSFNKVRYSLSRQQALNSTLSAYAALSGQWSDKNLDSSEKFYLGGANAVRAYPNGEAGGTSGQLLNLELRWRLPKNFNLSAFYDTGTVSANRLQGGVVNNSGLLEASALVNDGGTIRLAASDSINHSGTILADGASSGGNGGHISVIADLSNPDSHTEVGGSISARAGTQGGNGGFVETSGATLHIADSASLDTSAPQGLTGSWLLDPKDFTIAAGKAGTITGGVPSGDISGATLGTALGSSNVTISSGLGSTATGGGDININDTVAWTHNTLTLTAARDININAVMTAGAVNNTHTAGTFAILAMNPATTNGSDTAVTGGMVKADLGPGGFSGHVDFMQSDGITPRSGTGFLTIGGLAYTVLTTLGAQGSATGLDLQGMSGTPATNYALGGNIDGSASSGWTNKFTPSSFSANFNGLGHTIRNLVVKGSGLFATQPNGYTIANVGMATMAMGATTTPSTTRPTPPAPSPRPRSPSPPAMTALRVTH